MSYWPLPELLVDGVRGWARGSAVATASVSSSSTVTTWREALDAAAGDTYLLPLIPRLSEVQHLIDRAVLTASSRLRTSRTETQAADGLISRSPGQGRRDSRRRSVRGVGRPALGIQCNGYPAFERFGSQSPSPLLFFDTRLTADHVRLARAAGGTTPAVPSDCVSRDGSSTRRGHSTRSLPLSACTASGSTAPSTSSASARSSRSSATAGSHVRFMEGMDFAQGWTTYVRDEVDLMVLPHTQGDPSGTYLEAAGCGVPIVGFDNVALDSLVRRHGIGSTAALRDDVALAQAAGTYSTTRAVGLARDNGLRFMEEHCFERESDRRVEHLAGLSL